MPFGFRATALSIAAAGALNAFQPAFDEAHAKAVSNNPAGLRFHLEVAGGKSVFRMGERISLSLCFSSSQAQLFMAESRTQDRIGRLNYTEEFLVSPRAQAEDPLRNTMRGGGGLGGLSGGDVLLTARPYCFNRDLNEYIRFHRAGEYQLYVLSRRVRDLKPGEDWRTPRSRPPLTAVSNALRLSIVKPSPVWQRSELTRIVAALEARPADETAQRQLRYLDTYEAALEMARRLGGPKGSYQYLLGLIGSPYRGRVLPMLEEQLAAPDRAINDTYIETMEETWLQLAFPEPLKWPPRDEAARKAYEEEAGRRLARRRAQEAAYLTRLAGSLGGKLAAVQPQCVRTLLDYSKRYGGEPAPPWAAGVRAFAVRRFAALGPDVQNSILSFHWPDFRIPAMLGPIEDLYARAPNRPSGREDSRELLLRRIYELDPARGRALIVSAITGPAPPLSAQLLSILPDSSLPGVQEKLAERMERGDYVEPLIVRFAGPAIYARVRKVYEQRRRDFESHNLPRCLSPIHYYFLRVDPPYGKQEIASIVSNAGNPAPACKNLAWLAKDLGTSIASPALEELAISYLTSPVVLIKQGAAEILGLTGSVRSKAPLWDTFQYWHDCWKDRARELLQRPLDENVQFERTLGTALAQAANWVLTSEEWQRLRQLCLTRQCTDEVQAQERAAAQPEIRLNDPGVHGGYGAVGQYRAPTEAALLAKIGQYPKGTPFRWSLPFGANKEMDEPEYARWRSRLEKMGMQLNRAQ